MITYVSKSSTSDCLEVSKMLHRKFKFLEGDGSSEVKHYCLCITSLLCLFTSQNSWKWFLYNRTQNVNRPPSESDHEPAKKAPKLKDKNRHLYPSIPDSADDNESNQQNKELLLTEFKKENPSNRNIKNLMTRTFAIRQAAILNSQFLSIEDVSEELWKITD